ncbi:RusA family crossover junction endodeoxyribonuclease [Clostridium oryzae]|uniref:Endodeoxyribonuclease RusA n=1 Tax=Clostridium oryzae TaxID=1450648 RepID=A0A1V4INV7_9CLOT|nr:RusA family crossover junction endodeoxyribonuclease [Clostridium oryzae]OPJ61549.1 endodeoxyribonuclease RusA [Clostridium oryzae]
MLDYAKVIVTGSPISKSNFKLFNMHGRAILPYNSGKYHDRYAIYEQEIAFCARLQNPNIVLSQSLIAVLKVFYKSEKRHPDTNNITKSIFDGIEKSGLIVNDAQITRLIIEEFYDSKNPRFELELFGESRYNMKYEICTKKILDEPKEYGPPSNKKNSYLSKKSTFANTKEAAEDSKIHCSICNKVINAENSVTANNGKMRICKDCIKKLF